MTLQPQAAHEIYGEWLRKNRERAGLTQDDLAERAGLSDGGTVGRLERGVRNPHLSTRKAIERVLDEALDDDPRISLLMGSLAQQVIHMEQRFALTNAIRPTGWATLLATAQRVMMRAPASWSEPLRLLGGGTATNQPPTPRGSASLIGPS